MATTSEQNDPVEKDMMELDTSKLQRLRGGIDDFQDEYTKIVAQAEQDLPKLIAAGFDGSKLPKFQAYQEKLLFEHAKRVNAEPGISDSEYKVLVNQSKRDRTILMAAARFIHKRTNKAEDKKVYSKIVKKQGILNILNGNIALAEFARKNAEIVKEVRPDGQVIDETFLSRVEADATKLLKLKGSSSATDTNLNEIIERQNRILSLCVSALKEIKTFAEQAFIFDPVHYSKGYVYNPKGPNPPPPDNGNGKKGDSGIGGSATNPAV